MKKQKKPIKPEIKTATYVNLLELLQYMEDIGHTGIHDRVWAHLCDGEGFSNDCYIDGHHLDPNGFWDETEYQELIQDLKNIENEFGPVYNGLLEISW